MAAAPALGQAVQPAAGCGARGLSPLARLRRAGRPSTRAAPSPTTSPTGSSPAPDPGQIWRPRVLMARAGQWAVKPRRPCGASKCPGSPLHTANIELTAGPAVGGTRWDSTADLVRPGGCPRLGGHPGRGGGWPRPGRLARWPPRPCWPGRHRRRPGRPRRRWRSAPPPTTTARSPPGRRRRGPSRWPTPAGGPPAS